MEQEGNREILSVRNLSLYYNPEKPLVAEMNGVIEKGEMVALVGRNGSGKSTLLRTLASIQPIHKGQVFLEHFPLESYSPARLSRLLSFVGTGRTITENISVYEMVSIGRHPYTNWWGKLGDKDKDIIQQAVRFVGMENHMHSRLENLSDGERQRAMIAAALAQDTNLVVLDEPTAFLDVPNKLEIAEVLHRLKNDGRSILFSTHDFETVFNYADKLWVIHENRVIQGAPEDLGIQQVFRELFSMKNILFDEINLRFKRQTEWINPVYVRDGDEISRQWTIRALERCGYRVTDKENDAWATLIIHKEGEKLRWQIYSGDTNIQFHSLYELASFLTKA